MDRESAISLIKSRIAELEPGRIEKKFIRSWIFANAQMKKNVMENCQAKFLKLLLHYELLHDLECGVSVDLVMMKKLQSDI